WLVGVEVDRLALSALPRAPDDGAAPPTRLPCTAPPLPFTFTRARLFGLAFDSISARLSTEPQRLALDDLAFAIQDAEPAGAEGRLRVDTARKTIAFSSQGRVGAAHVETFLAALGLSHTQRILRRLEFPPPWPETRFDITASYEENALALALDFNDANGSYRGVPFTRVGGHVAYAETNAFSRLELSGFSGFSEFAPARLSLVMLPDTLDIEAGGTLRPADINTLAGNFMNPAHPARIAALGPVTATLNGRIDLDAWDAMDFRGAFSFENGDLDGFPASSLAGRYACAGPRLRVEPLAWVASTGNRLGGGVEVDFAPNPGRFSAHVQSDRLTLAELAPLFAATNAALNGWLRGGLRVEAALDDPARVLSGGGDIAIYDANLVRFPLFAGLTDFLAEYIPGVDWLTKQTSAKCEFTVTNGVLRVAGLEIKGDIFAISGNGSYDIAGDELDLTVKSHLFSKKTFVGKITQLILSPVNYLLLTQQITGPRDAPRVRNVSVTGRLVNGILDIFDFSGDTPE
ncbi:MAG: hypothetical protein FWF96_06060, partial [Kiritimatiellaeota bacterium]|nr:hypothetical protein [Kiritimatiellota bacterium]